MFNLLQNLTKVMISHWYMDIAPAKIISVRIILILADLPNILCRMPVQCSSVCHSLFVL